jgi:hypothetical protein
MDQQTRVAGTYVVAILLFMIAFMFFCFGLGLLFALPDLLGFLGIVVLAFSGVFIYSGIRNLNDAKLMNRDAALQLKTISPPSQVEGNRIENKDAIVSDVTILARWQYSKEEWSRFMKWERSRRKTSSTIEAVLIIVLGSLLLRSLRDASWTTAIAISSGLAMFYWLGKYFTSMNSIGKRASNEVILTTRSVIVNGKMNSLRDGLYFLKKVELIEENDISVIQFEYGWNTRKGPSSEQIRVPVPANKLEEAKEVVKQY